MEKDELNLGVPLSYEERQMHRQPSRGHRGCPKSWEWDGGHCLVPSQGALAIMYPFWHPLEQSPSCDTGTVNLNSC